MSIVPDTERRRSLDHGPVVTLHRQTRRADPDLVQLDRRILALEGRGRVDPAAACRVVRLRQRLGHLLRDRAAGGAQWVNDGRNLEFAVEQEEAPRG